MLSITKKKIGILRGGKGKNYASSIRRGGDLISYIFEHLPEQYKIIDILIDKDGIWHVNGLPIIPADLTGRVDVVWNTVPDDTSAILSSLAIPHISAGFFSSSLPNSRDMLRGHMKKLGVEIPRSILIPLYQEDFDGPRERYAIKKAKEVFEKFAGPWIVKSFTPDAGMGIHVAKTFGELSGAIEDGVKHGNSILVEELIMGKVASIHSVAGFRGEEVYTFPLGSSFGNFSTEEKEKFADLSQKLHGHTGSRHYLKSDLVLTSRGKIYLLQMESIPDLRPNSHFHQVCESVGVLPHNVIEHILENALK